MKIIPIPTPTDNAPLEPWVPFDFIEEAAYGDHHLCPYGDLEGFVQGADMSADGTICTIVEETGVGGTGWMLVLDTPFDFSTVSGEHRVSYARSMDCSYSYDGNYFFHLEWTKHERGAIVYSYSLSTPWDTRDTSKTLIGSFAVPDIIFGYTRGYLRNMDISEDGKHLYMYDSSQTLLTDNPTGERGVMYVYEMSTPFDASTMAEHSIFVMADQFIEGRPIYSMTVWTRGHHVDQIAVFGLRMVNFNFPDGLEHKYSRDGGNGNLGASEYMSANVHKHIRGYTFANYGSGVGGGTPRTASQSYTTYPG